VEPIALLIADVSDLVLGALLQPSWGVYLNGSPVIQPASILGQVVQAQLAPIQAIAGLLGAPNIVPVSASTVDFQYAQEWPISNYPQEAGAFQSYDKVTLPFDVKLRLAAGGSQSNRQAFLQTCLAIANSLALFDVVTPEMVFTSVNCIHIDWDRNATRGATLISVDLGFQQIAVQAAASFSNTQQPGNAGQQSIGNVQPQTPSSQVQSSFSALGIN
jgi:hypothetical protein